MKKVVQDFGFVISFQTLAPHTPGKQGARGRIMNYVPVAKTDYPDVLAQIMAQHGFQENPLLIQDGSGDIFGAQARPKLEEDDEKKGKKAAKTLLELRVSSVRVVNLLVEVPDETPAES